MRRERGDLRSILIPPAFAVLRQYAKAERQHQDKDAKSDNSKKQIQVSRCLFILLTDRFSCLRIYKDMYTSSYGTVLFST